LLYISIRYLSHYLSSQSARGPVVLKVPVSRNRVLVPHVAISSSWAAHDHAFDVSLTLVFAQHHEVVLPVHSPSAGGEEDSSVQ
jgi:hypothetical protein